jgi:hypothetical protein
LGLGPPQTASRFPFRWCGMKPTVSGISQLDVPPGLHSVQEEVLDTSEPRYADPRGYADPIQSAYVRTGVNKIMTRFAVGQGDTTPTRATQGLALAPCGPILDQPALAKVHAVKWTDRIWTI